MCVVVMSHQKGAIKFQFVCREFIISIYLDFIIITIMYFFSVLCFI